jgi:pimeloyl-ACP methyl ester carboxylesterase
MVGFDRDRYSSRPMSATASRWDLQGEGGHPLAVWIDGEGPALVLVHGSMCDHTALDGLVAELRRDFATFAMDRRGFGSSPDTDDYSAEREFDDVAAVVDAVAERDGGPVVLFGHSWGASCAIGAALRSRNVRRLVLYEPSLGLRYPRDLLDHIEAQVAAGDAEGAILSVLTDLAGLTEEQAEAMRSGPSWPARLATAPTIVREARIEDGWVHRPGEFAAIAAPTLFLEGSESPPELTEVTRQCAAAIANARVHMLEGHGHCAYRTHPAEVAAIVARFAGE